MLRKITKPAGRYGAGITHDYPQGVWNKIALDLAKDKANAALFKGCKPGDAAAALDAFSEPADNPFLQNMHRGAFKPRPRLGSAT